MEPTVSILLLFFFFIVHNYVFSISLLLVFSPRTDSRSLFNGRWPPAPPHSSCRPLLPFVYFLCMPCYGSNGSSIQLSVVVYWCLPWFYFDFQFSFAATKHKSNNGNEKKQHSIQSTHSLRPLAVHAVCHSDVFRLCSRTEDLFSQKYQQNKIKTSSPSTLNHSKNETFRCSFRAIVDWTLHLCIISLKQGLSSRPLAKVIANQSIIHKNFEWNRRPRNAVLDDWCSFLVHSSFGRRQWHSDFKFECHLRNVRAIVDGAILWVQRHRLEHHREVHKGHVPLFGWIAQGCLVGGKMYVNENYAKQHLHLIAKLVYHSIVSSRIGAGVQIKNKRKKKKQNAPAVYIIKAIICNFIRYILCAKWPNDRAIKFTLFQQLKRICNNKK